MALDNMHENRYFEHVKRSLEQLTERRTEMEHRFERGMRAEYDRVCDDQIKYAVELIKLGADSDVDDESIRIYVGGREESPLIFPQKEIRELIDPMQFSVLFPKAIFDDDQEEPPDNKDPVVTKMDFTQMSPDMQTMMLTSMMQSFMTAVANEYFSMQRSSGRSSPGGRPPDPTFDKKYEIVCSERDALKEKYDNVCSERDALIEKREAAYSERDALKLKLKEAEDSLSEWNSRYDSAVKQYNDLKSEAENKINEAQRRLAAAQQQFGVENLRKDEEISKRKEALETERRKLEEQNQQLSEEATAALKQAEDAKKLSDEYRIKFDEASKRAEDAADRVSEKKREIESLQKELESVRSEIEVKRKDADDASEKIIHAEANLNHERQVNAELQAQLSEAKNRANGLNQKLEDARRDKERLEKQLESTKAQKADSESMKDQIEAMRKELDAARSEKAGAERRAEEAEKKLGELAASQKSLIDEVDTLKEENETMSEKAYRDMKFDVGNILGLHARLGQADIESLGMVDIFGMGDINREFSEESGDKAIRYTIQALTDRFGEGNVFRTRGAQFAVTSTLKCPNVEENLKDIRKMLDEEYDVPVVIGFANVKKRTAEEAINVATDSLKKARRAEEEKMEEEDDDSEDDMPYRGGEPDYLGSQDDVDYEDPDDDTPRNPNMAFLPGEENDDDDEAIVERDSTRYDLATELLGEAYDDE